MNVLVGIFAGIASFLKGAFSLLVGLYGGSLTASFLLFAPLVSLVIFLIPLLAFTILFPELFPMELIDWTVEAVDFTIYGISAMLKKLFTQYSLDTKKLLAVVTSITFGVYAFFIGAVSTTILGFGLGFIFLYTLGSAVQGIFTDKDGEVNISSS
jgi:hypothetical protein